MMRYGLVLLLLLSACKPSEPDTTASASPETAPTAQPQALRLASTAFKQHDPIPALHSCDGKDVSPALAWIDKPKDTRSLAIIVDDLDSPDGNFTHWLIYNVPPEISILPEDLPKTDTLSLGALQGRNGFNKIGWAGPCPPPPAPHRYVFRLYALDAMLIIEPGATRKQLEAAMDGHLLGQTQLTGVYQRSK